MRGKCKRPLIALFSRLITCLFIIQSVGCDDPPPPPSAEVVDAQVDLGSDLPADMMMDDADQERVVDAVIPLGQTPNWLEIKLTPSRTYYALSETPTLRVSMFDLYGDEIINPQVIVKSLVSGSLTLLRLNGDLIPFDAEVSLSEATIQFLREGETSIEVCATDSAGQATDVCAQREMIVDDAPPQIEVFWPPRGAQLAWDDLWPEWSEVVGELPAPDQLFGGLNEQVPSSLQGSFPLYGRLTDGSMETRLFVNDQEVSFDEAGRFSALIEAKSGYVELSIIADDGVRGAPSYDRRWVLFSERYSEVTESGSVVTDGLSIGLHQDAIDADSALPSNPPLILSEAAQLIELIIENADPSLFLGAGQIAQGSGLSISIVDVDLGRPDVDLLITSGGLAMQLELNQAVADLRGQVTIADTVIDLSGSIDLGLSAYADYEVLLINDTLQMRFVSGAVALNRLDPRLNSEAANALLIALESTARTLIVEEMEGQLIAALRDELPASLEEAAMSVLNTLNNLTLPIDTGVMGLPLLTLDLRFNPSEVELIPRGSLSLLSQLEIQRESDTPTAQPTELRGYPSLYGSNQTIPLLDPLSIQLNIDVINALFTELWRGGLLNLAPPLPPSVTFLISDAYLTAKTPPVVRRGQAGEAYPLYLELGGMELSLTQGRSGIADQYEVYIRSGARLNVEASSLRAVFTEVPEVEVTLAKLNNESVQIAEQLIVSVIQNDLWPQLVSSIVSQLVFPIPESPLYLDTLVDLGVTLPSSRIRFDLRDEVRYLDSWIVIGGSLEMRVE